ncbi:gustatory and pheromone receptor 39a isoform X2 [Drosophila ananassae]|uniref:gustatory and pheromone receptor 39a isoform X2 n=1 Tax=Drosophila ananassae TaxID=7217 RepID=UPI0013A5E7D4|nr:gustatory and pheromone receptor 39a isoform X2 [Drosophila ananassae]XP_044571986.1 gustatory and pheromone receptor 39a isoform X2 [Drosophila ananassae]
MSPGLCRDLRIYLRLLHLLGMMCWHFDSEACELSATPPGERYALLYTLAMLVASAGCFTFVHLQPQIIHLTIYNRTGNFYETIIFRSTCLVLCLLYGILYLRRHRHRKLVQDMLRLNRKCLDKSTDKQFLHYLILYGVLTVLGFGNLLNGYSQSGMAPLALALCLVVYVYAFLVLCLLLVFFVCLKMIMAAGLGHYNRQLCLEVLPSELNGRQRILAICQGELADCFGQLMLPIVALILLMGPSGPFYMISTIMEGKFESRTVPIIFISSATWGLPWIIMLVLMLRSNGITVEANKTAKILAKVPRTGTGLDKMIEKFLLKNLRQQPILTAYGFFALDKSTLFKLFTAIFTYMVILVQFKEMENSTKSIKV